MKRLFQILSFLSGMMIIAPKLGAQPQTPVKIQHYSTEDGLSHDIITTMFKDREGYMWFGTWSGLNRFDGNHFRSFRSVASDSSQIANNRIDHISEDNNGQLWVKAYDSQIYRFSKVSEKFRSLAAILGMAKKPAFDQVFYCDHNELWVSLVNGGIIHVPDIKNRPTTYVWYQKNTTPQFQIASNTINCFMRDRDGDVWLGMSTGLVHLDRDQTGNYIRSDIPTEIKGKIAVKTVSVIGSRLVFGADDGMLWIYDSKDKQFKSIAVSQYAINQILISKDQHRLYATSNGGELIVLDLGSSSFKKYRSPDGSPLFTLFEDKRGSIWIEPDKKGVLRFDQHGQFETYSQKNDSKNISAGNHFKVFEDSNGTVWCVLRDGGYGYFDYSTDTFKYFHNEPGAKDRIFSNLVTVAFYDPVGVMWLHTDEHGLEKVIFQPHGFQQHLVNPAALFQSDNEIRSVCVDRLNRAWICAKGGQVYWLRQGELRQANFINLKEHKLGAVYAIKEDRKGNVWMGTKTNGLYEAIPVDQSHNAYRLINFAHDSKNPHSISSNQIYAINEDDKGDIWIGTFDKGLNLLQGDQEHISFLQIDKEKYNYPTGLEKIRTIETGRKGELWIGTTEGLIVMTSNKNGFKFNVYHKQAGIKKSLGNNDIQFIHRDHAGNMWLATSGGGLDMAVENTSTGNVSFVNYTTKQGLANDYILSCAEDHSNHLWIATKGSLARLNLATKAIKNFTSYDGLQTAGFSEGTCQNTLDGKLIFGTIHGYLMFDPQAISPHPIAANLVFTNLRVNNEQIDVEDSTGILRENVNYTNSISLKHNQNVVSLEYALLDYRFDSNLPFMYRLKGFDTEWHDNTNQLRATYTNIPAGDYLLEIKCADAERYSNSLYKSLAIKVLPAPWLSWWAYLLYIIVVFSIGFIVWRSLFTALKLKHEMAVEHQLTELKLNFFTNISHELRTPLMLILNPIVQLRKYTNLEPRQYQYLAIVNRNADRMVRFINQLLEFRKIQYGKGAVSTVQFEMTRFLKDIGEHFEDIRNEKQIELVFKGTEQSFEVLLDQDKIETVIYNLLSNAFKFTPHGKTITVSLDCNLDRKELTLTVSDQGQGVPEEDLEVIFELYHSDGSSSLASDKGTGIGLALSKELIELHGGKITAQNNVTGGLAVKIILPYDKPSLSGISPGPQHAGVERLNVQGTDETNIQHVKKDAPLLVLVEDNLDMREFLKMQLSEIYRVETAADGLEGLEMVRSLMPDLVLSDVMMPRMDGIALIDKIKNDGYVSHIPVVLMSARSAVEHQIMGLNYGADYYLSKPFRNELLIAAINNILEQRKKLFQRLRVDEKIINLAPSDIVVTSKDEIFMKNVLKIMDENMANPDFDIEKVSHLLNMGRANFYKKFKSLTQIAPVEFVRDMRLQRAKQYFDAGGGNVAEIAYTVGFSSPKYFSTCFRTKYHMSPSDYLRHQRSQISEESQQP